MSVRATREYARTVLQDGKKAVSDRIEQDKKIASAIDTALTSFDDRPTIQTACELVLDILPTYKGRAEHVTCSECFKKSYGWEPHWTHCPACGSTIKSYRRENEPSRAHENKILSGVKA